MDLPDNLHELKRAALQKLCKAFGIRANMKASYHLAASLFYCTSICSGPFPTLECGYDIGVRRT